MDWNSLFCEERIRPSESMAERKSGKDPRTEFDSDFGRVVFSSAARRLHDKTQVIPLTTDDNVHSRLTHSMEVMNVGESIIGFIFAKKADLKIPDGQLEEFKAKLSSMVKTTCLMHDIGNPPFGHFGEDAISSFFKENRNKEPINRIKEDELIDFLQFDGNAQGFRVLTKLQCLEDLFGLNLTKGTLAAYLKYPNVGSKNKKGEISQHKHGVFSSDWDYAKMALDSCKCDCIEENTCYYRHPASYIMEAADSICYLSMDIEDAYNKGWIKVCDIWEFMLSNGCSEETVKKLFRIKEDLEYHGVDYRKKYYDDGRAYSLIVAFRRNLINYLINHAADIFVSNFDGVFSGNYKEELIFDDKNNVANCLKQFCINKIYSQKEIMSLEVTGLTVIQGLISILSSLFHSEDPGVRNRGKAIISRSIMRANVLDYKVSSSEWEYDPSKKKYYGLDDATKEKVEIDVIKKASEFDVECFSEYYKYRVIVDFVSGMTDKYAVPLYQKLSGWAL